MIPAFLLAACGGDSEQSGTDAEAAVRAELKAYYADFSARDWDAFAAHFWPGATITTAWQAPDADSVAVVTQTVDEFVAAAPAGPGSREIFEEWMTDAQIVATSTLASAWVHYGARFGDPGDVMEWQGIDAFTLMQVGGEWRIAALAFAPDTGEPE